MRIWQRFTTLALLILVSWTSLPYCHAQAESQRKILRVVLDDNYPPFIFRGGDGTLQGILIDQWNLWSERTGVKAELTATDWGVAQKRMLAGEFDVIDTIFVNEKRKQIYEFSPPYARIDVPIFFHAELSGIRNAEDLQGFAIAAKTGDLVIDFLREKGVTTFHEFPSYEAIVVAAKQGKTKVFTVDSPPAHYFMTKYGIADLYRETAPLYSGEFHRAVLKGNSGILAFVMEGFGKITPAEYAEIDQRWMGKRIGVISGIQTRHIVLGVGTVAAVLLLLIFWLSTLRRAVNRKTAELQRVTTFLDMILENIPNMIFLKEAGELRFVRFNKAGEELLGSPREALIGKNDYDIFPREQADFFTSKDRAVLSQNLAVDIPEEPLQTRHRGTRILHTKKVPIMSADGEPEYLLGISEDITELLPDRKAIRETEERIRLLSDNLPNGMVYQVDSGPEGAYRQFTYLSAGVQKLHGLSPEEAMADAMGIYGQIHPEDAERVAKAETQAITGMKTFQEEARIRMPDGSVRWSLFRSSPRRNAAGQIIWDGIEIDISERKQTEQALRESQRRLEEAQRIAALGSWELDLTTNTLSWSEEVFRIFEIDKEKFGASYAAFLDATHPDDREMVNAAYKSSLATRKPYETTHRLLMADGRVKYVVEQCETYYGEDGTPLRSLGTIQDVTRQKEIQNEKASLMAQLGQAQKMEAIGRLAGGVAHDFNNMLSVIIGNAEMAVNETGLPPNVQERLHEILNAAERSANITRQLLAFARKQTITPRLLDLDEAIPPMIKMLKRLIGEDIELIWSPDNRGGMVKIDPSQLDQILANLATNARDAISGPGRVEVRTGVASFDKEYCDEHPSFLPGEYSFISVSDNGCGIGKDLIPWIFEPFVTTKESGKGTGLGLATVYGIVDQNSGFIHVASEPGQGTTFKVYLPRAEGAEAAPKPVGFRKAPRGTETVLVVEDEPSNLQLMQQALSSLGYTILATSDPIQAMDIARRHTGGIDLLLTDVVMPRMNGRELVDAVSAIRPGIGHLYVSGYTSGIISDKGILSESENFLEKPYTIFDLATKVREALHRR